MTEKFHSDGSGLQRPEAGTLFTRTPQQQWQRSGSEGFLLKPLFEDPATSRRTWLMKVEPGAYSPPHAHEELEEFYIIDGSFSDGENIYRAGDYVIRAPGTMHEARSDEGATVLLVYSA